MDTAFDNSNGATLDNLNQDIFQKSNVLTDGDLDMDNKNTNITSPSIDTLNNIQSYTIDNQKSSEIIIDQNRISNDDYNFDENNQHSQVRNTAPLNGKSSEYIATDNYFGPESNVDDDTTGSPVTEEFHTKNDEIEHNIDIIRPDELVDPHGIHYESIDYLKTVDEADECELKKDEDIPDHHERHFDSEEIENESKMFAGDFVQGLPKLPDAVLPEKGDDIMLYRPSNGYVFVLRNLGSSFYPIYSSMNGIGGYDLKSTSDLAFSFDYNHSGKKDHVGIYRPGTGTMWILKHNYNSYFENFSPVYAQGDPGKGIGGYDLKSIYDRAFAFDYNHSGKQDHIALYRPGTGTMWILKNQNGQFSPVYKQGDPGNGIGGYDLKSRSDRAFAFDFDHSGKMDHIVLYRPGTGTMWILKNKNGQFSPVYKQGDPGNGIGGYDLKSPVDSAFAFDYDHSGKMDHIVLYRPATGTMWILKNKNGQFSPVYKQGDPGNGIGGYDLKSRLDYAFAFDYNGNGRKDHIALTRPGTGTMWILKNQNGQFSPVYKQGDPGNGIGGYDLKSSTDRVITFD